MDAAPFGKDFLKNLNAELDDLSRSGQLSICLVSVQLPASDKLAEREGGEIQLVVPAALWGSA